MKQYLIFFLLVLLGMTGVSAALTDQLEYYYTFDNHLEDNVSSNDLSGTYDAFSATSKLGSHSLHFDAANEYVDSASNHGYTGAEARSANVWINLDSTGGTMHFFSLGTSTGTGDRFEGQKTSSPVWRLDAWGVNVAHGNTPTTGTFTMLTFTYNTTHLCIYENATGKACNSATLTGADSVIRVGARHGYVDQDLVGYIDELGFWNRSLTDAEVTSLYNSGDGLAYPFGGAPSESASISIQTLNMTNNVQTNFTPEEDFKVHLNWSTNLGTQLGLDNGTITLNIEDGTIREAGNGGASFVFCDGPCAVDTYYSEVFNITDGVLKDFVEVKACNIQNSGGSVTINVSCSGGSHQEVIPAVNFPLCTDGLDDLFLNTTACIGQSIVNVSFTTAASNSERKNFSFFFEREYANLTLTNADMTEVNGLINTTLPEHIGEPGTFNIYVDANFSTDASLDASAVQSTLITAPDPHIFLDEVETDLGVTHPDNFSQIEFADGNFIFHMSEYSAFFGPDYLIIEVFNSTGHQIYNQTNTSVFVETFILPSSTFLEFDGNPYNFSLFINNTNGQFDYNSYLLTINDTVNPTMTNIANVTANINTTVLVTHDISDEYIWSVNMTCSNATRLYVNNYNTSIAATTFIEATRFRLNQSVDCILTVADGHTNNKIKDMKVDKLKNEDTLVFNDHKIKFKKTVDDFTVTKKIDRYNFCVDFAVPQQTFNIEVPNDWRYAPESGYKGHFVHDADKLWIDFEGDHQVTYLGNNTVQVNTTSAYENYCFNSIGELNVVTGSYHIDAVIPQLPYSYVSEDVYEPATTGEAIIWVGMLFLWILVFFLMVTVKGSNGATVGFFNIIQLLLGIVVGTTFINNYSALLGFGVLMIAGGAFAVKVLDN